jgi:lysophospholipase L1-like esterase
MRESLRRYEREVAAVDPDLVVIYHATNDLSRNSREVAQAQGVLDDWGDRGLSRLSDWSMLAYLVEKNLRILLQQKRAADPRGKIKLDKDALARPFEDDLRALVRTVQDSGAKVALATFSIRLRAAQTPEKRIEAAAGARYYMPFMTPDDLLASYAAYNDVIRNVAADERALLLDVANAIPADSSHFADSVHLTDAGAEAMADAILRALSDTSARSP